MVDDMVLLGRARVYLMLLWKAVGGVALKKRREKAFRLNLLFAGSTSFFCLYEAPFSMALVQLKLKVFLFDSLQF